ncbi:MAG: hypothetical protein CMN29_30325 [Sandaracinus sp.]|nr:hypothetical protein [Myxococcales bacterium]MAT29183.1 hypothetical protein [Sandaracinus sp.]
MPGSPLSDSEHLAPPIGGLAAERVAAATPPLASSQAEGVSIGRSSVERGGFRASVRDPRSGTAVSSVSDGAK